MDIEMNKIFKNQQEAKDTGDYLMHLIETYPNIDKETLIKYLDEYFELMGYGVEEA